MSKALTQTDHLTAKACILSELQKYGKVETEYQFNPKRKFRADFALVEHRILVEYEGVSMKTDRGNYGHQTGVGYTNNCTKYNLATVQGWRVLRYTALNFSQISEDLRQIFERNTGQPIQRNE